MFECAGHAYETGFGVESFVGKLSRHVILQLNPHHHMIHITAGDFRV